MKQMEQIENYETLNEEAVYAEYVKKDITDDFIFGKVMQKKENCIGLLECLTGNKIENVRTVISQKAVKVTNDSKGVRYDIYVEDDIDRIYDAEMQNYNKKSDVEALPKRTRFYQGMMDLNILESGADYHLLKESYVIFICMFDPFGKDLCCYEFENICKDDKELKFNDGRKILIFNAKGKYVNVSKPIADFLKYLETKKVTDEFTRQLDNEVVLARQNREWMVEYMKTLVHDMDVKNEGIAIGMERGLKVGISQGIEQGISQGITQGISQGITQGISDSIIEFLSEYGEVPQSLKDKIYAQKDVSLLKQWNKLSAKVSSIEEFMEKM